MTVPISEALAPLAKRISREVRDIEVLRVSAQLNGEGFRVPAETAGKAVLAWAKKRAGRSLPPAAWDMRDFELPVGGRSCKAVRIQDSNLDLWALRVEDPDKNVAGRTWVTEIVIGGEVSKRPHVSLRLVVSTREPDLVVDPHVPGPVLQMIESPGLIRGTRELSVDPIIIDSESDAESLCDLLEDSNRHLPVFVVVLQEENNESLIDDKLLAKATAGLARTVKIPPELTWIITQRFGKKMSVFNSGVRAYLGGFTPYDDPYRHRLFLEGYLRQEQGAKSCVGSLRALAAEVSVVERRLGKDVLDFASVRTASRKLSKSTLLGRAASDKEVLKTAEELVESLEKQIDELNSEIDSYFSEIAISEERALAAEAENRTLLHRLRYLARVSAEGGENPTDEPPLPQEWSEFSDWLDHTYPDKVQLTPGARRMLGAPEFEDVALVARAVQWLATVQHERRVNGGGSLRDEPVENGIINAPCGGDKYRLDWKGRRYDVDWHIKNGGNVRDPKRCLRIYYFWEDDLQQTVIASLPAHRRTGAT